MCNMLYLSEFSFSKVNFRFSFPIYMRTFLQVPVFFTNLLPSSDYSYSLLSRKQLSVQGIGENLLKNLNIFLTSVNIYVDIVDNYAYSKHHRAHVCDIILCFGNNLKFFLRNKTFFTVSAPHDRHFSRNHVEYRIVCI